MTSIEYITEFCTGCGLCHSIQNTAFESNSKGFYIPNIKENREFFEKVCPVYYYSAENVDFNLWGHYVSVYSGYSNNAGIRHLASSGGVLTEISKFLLENHIVEGVIQTGISNDSPIGTQTFCSTTTEEVIRNCGSRYSVSAPLMNLRELILENKKYAFIGKPCDVASLKRYMEEDAKIKEKIVMTMSFFCAGMPSLDSNKKLLLDMGCGFEKCKSIQYRGNGWPGEIVAKDNDDNEYRFDYAIAWGDYLGRDVRNVCRYCMDGIGELADIVCADLWYLKDNNKPDFTEHEGVNAIFCRTEIGDKVIRDMERNGCLHINDYKNGIDNFQHIQPYQFERRTTMKYRLLALSLFGRCIPMYNRRFLNKANKFATTRMNWNIFIGTIKRILRGKL